MRISAALFCALNPESPSEEYFDFYAQIDESKQLIEQYKKEIAKIKNIGCCKKCGAPLDRDAKYCSVCGASQEEEKKRGTFRICDMSSLRRSR